MAILVDDEPYQPAGGPEQTVQELANEVCQIGRAPQERLVVGLRCDGQAVADDQLDRVLQTPARAFDQLELQTQSTRALLRVTLDQTIDVFEDAAPVGRHAADLLAEGKHDEAMQALQRLCDLFKQAQQALVFSAQALKLELDDIRVNDLDLTAIMHLLKDPLAQLKEAMDTGDLVVAGDVLRYDLDEPLGHWLALLRHLRGQAGANET